MNDRRVGTIVIVGNDRIKTTFRPDQSGRHLIISGASYPAVTSPLPSSLPQRIYPEYSILLTERTIEAHIYTYERRGSARATLPLL